MMEVFLLHSSLRIEFTVLDVVARINYRERKIAWHMYIYFTRKVAFNKGSSTDA